MMQTPCLDVLEQEAKSGIHAVRMLIGIEKTPYDIDNETVSKLCLAHLPTRNITPLFERAN